MFLHKLRDKKYKIKNKYNIIKSNTASTSLIFALKDEYEFNYNLFDQ